MTEIKFSSCIVYFSLSIREQVFFFFIYSKIWKFLLYIQIWLDFRSIAGAKASVPISNKCKLTFSEDDKTAKKADIDSKMHHQVESRHFWHRLHNTWVYNRLSMSMAFQIVIYVMSMLMVNSVSYTVGNLISIIKTFCKFLLSCKENLWQLYIFKIPKLLLSY